MRPLKLILIAVLGATLIPDTAAAHRPADPCAALKGRDLAPGAGQRAVRKGSTLYFCRRGGKVRRLGGSPVVAEAEGLMLLVHRRRVAEVLDVGTGRRVALGPADEIVALDLLGYGGAAAVRRTATGDTVLAAVPGHPPVVVEHGPGAVTGLAASPGLRWQRGGVSRDALFPSGGTRCGRLTGPDRLEGPGRIVEVGSGYLGCAGAPDDPVFGVGDRYAASPDESVGVRFTAGAGSWVLRAVSRSYPALVESGWDTLDLATGRFVHIARDRRWPCCEHTGNAVGRHVMLADGRSVSILDDDWLGTEARRSTVAVRGPGLAPVDLDRTDRDAPAATNLRVEGELVRWTVGGQERSAPLPAP